MAPVLKRLPAVSVASFRMELAAIIVSFAALGVSMVAAVHAKRSADAAEQSAVASREYTDIEAARRADEVRADVAVTTHWDANRAFMDVRNFGPGTATDIRVEVGDVFVERLDRPHILRLQRLGPGQSERSLVFLSLGDPQNFPANLHWLDGSGPRTESSIIEF